MGRRIFPRFGSASPVRGATRKGPSARQGISAQEIQQRVLKNVRSGSIILFHNAAEHTPEALPGIIEALQADGYTIVPVSQLLLQGETSIDNTGRQWAK